jgi:hypothetical protein
MRGRLQTEIDGTQEAWEAHPFSVPLMPREAMRELAPTAASLAQVTGRVFVAGAS